MDVPMSLDNLWGEGMEHQGSTAGGDFSHGQLLGGELFFPSFPVGQPGGLPAGVPWFDSGVPLGGAAGGLLPLAEAGPSSSSGHSFDRLNEGKEETAQLVKKHKAQQEKSKIAQKKYRDKKRVEATEMREQITDLRQQLEEALLEKSKLEQRNSLLEKVVHMRAEDQTMQERTELAVPEHILAARAFAKAVGDNSVELPSDGLIALSPEELMKLWRNYVRRLTQLLLDGADVEYSPASVELTALIRVQRRATLAMGQHNSATFLQRATKIKRMIREDWGQPPPDHSQKVLEAIQLSQEQKRMLVETRKGSVARVMGLMEERKEIVKAMRAAIDLAEASPSGHMGESSTLPAVQGASPEGGSSQPLPGGPESVPRAECINPPLQGSQLFSYGTLNEASSGALLDAANRLRDNYDRDCKEALAFLMSLKAVLSPLQEARMVVTSYPFHPALLTIYNLIGLEWGMAPIELPDGPMAELNGSIKDALCLELTPKDLKSEESTALAKSVLA